VVRNGAWRARKRDRAVRFAASVVGVCWSGRRGRWPSLARCGDGVLVSARAGERAEEGGVLPVGERREVGGRGKLPVGTWCQRLRERGAGGASTRAVRAVCAFTGRSVRSRPAERLRGCPFEETGRAGPRFGSRGGRPGRLLRRAVQAKSRPC